VNGKHMVLAMETNHVLINKIPRNHLLFFNHMFNIVNLVSNLSGLFKMELFGFFSHLFLQTLDQVFVLPLKEHLRLMDNFLVLAPVDLSATWASTTIHFIIDTGPTTA